MDESETQRLLRAEIADLRTALDERFDEIARLVQMQEEADARHAEELRRVTAEHRLPLLLEGARAKAEDPEASAGVASREEQGGLLAADPLFVREWYVETYPDVAQSGMDPVEHYLVAGTFECRDPGPDFSTRSYYLSNLDVAQSGWSALGHYLAFGREEGRRGGAAQTGQSNP